MMRWNDFGRSLVFAAVAAAAVVPFAILAEPWLGWRGTPVAYAALSAAAYLFGAAPSRSRGLLAAAALTAIATIVIAVSTSTTIAVCAIAVALGVLRSGQLYRRRFARSFLIEGVLISLGIGIASRLFDGSAFSAVLAVWAFYLTQSAFFLIGGLEACEPEPAGDAFEAAHARATQVLESTGVGKVR